MMLGNLLPLLDIGSKSADLWAASGIGKRQTFSDIMGKFVQLGAVSKGAGHHGLYRITERGRELLAIHFDRMSKGEQP
jgi:hypothetical protein